MKVLNFLFQLLFGGCGCLTVAFVMVVAAVLADAAGKPCFAQCCVWAFR